MNPSANPQNALGPSSKESGNRSRLINLRRLLVAAGLVGAVFAALSYFERESDQGASEGLVVEPAELLDTPQSEGGQLEVFAEQGSQAPNFEANRIEGDRLQLSDMRGSPVVLKFWATWCSSCLAEFPHFIELHQKYQPDGLRVLALNAGEEPEQAKEFSDFLDAPFDWALDPGLVVSDAYKIIGFPVSVFIDREGVVRALYVGQMDVEIVEAQMHYAPRAEARR